MSKTDGYERLKQRTGNDILQLPFECHHCRRQRFDLDMIDGDGFPVCIECINACVAMLETSEATDEQD